MRISHLAPATLLLSAGMAMAQSSFVFSKNGQHVFTITEDGSLTVWPGYYSESSPGTAGTGDLVIRENTLDANQEMRTNSAGNLLTKGRVFKYAVMPTTTGHLVLREGPRAATLTKSGDLYLRANNGFAGDPSANGPFAVTSAVYASSGTQLIPRFQTPTPNYVTPRKNISPFFNSVEENIWGFSASSVPINGSLRIPTGTGPFPVALFVHGRHSALDFSDEGYLYLCDMLASQGILAASIDANFLNAQASGENDARAILHLEHFKQFRTWNTQAGHPLFGKVDLNRIMIVGHSRGGEGVGHASYFNGLSSVVPNPGDPTVPLNGSNGLGPYNFGIQCVFAFSPTDGQYIPVGGSRGIDHNYFVIHGGMDMDFVEFQGLAAFDRSHKPNVANPSSTALGIKALCFVYKANHNFFNTTWDSDGNPALTMGRADQELVAKQYVGALAQGLLLGRTGHLELIKDPMSSAASLRPTSSLYVSGYQDRQRNFFDHYEEDANEATMSPPFTGTNYCFLPFCLESDLSSDANPWHRTKGIRMEWLSGSTGIYATSTSTPVANYQYLAVRVGQNNSSNNTVDMNQIFNIWAVDGTGTWGVVRSDQVANLPYPLMNGFGQSPTVMQTLRVPLSEYANQGVNPNDIRGVQFEFGTIVSSGSIHTDEFQYTY